MKNIFNNLFLNSKSKELNPGTKIECHCANPVIITNPKLRYYIYSINILHIFDSNEYLTNRSLDLLIKRLSRIKYKNSLDYETYKDYYAITFDGEIIPLYILVPCNKCFICKDKTSQMWQFRGIAESNSSKYPTLFLTLTYNNKFLPYNGISVTAIQLFMKRLRNNLDKLNISHSIKYFACGEYGSNTQRPHYHLILWHFPFDKFPNLKSILEFVERSWSIYNYDSEEHEQIGYAYCKPCDTGSLKYVMKYTRKLGIPPKGKNPFFTCCSKFVGYQYFLDNYDFLRKNPQLLTLSINDNICGDVYTSPYPTYYKNKLMPNLSQIFPKEILSACKIMLDLHVDINAISQLIPINYKIPDILTKLTKVFYDYKYSLQSLISVDDYTYHRYSHSCPFTLYQMAKKKIANLQVYEMLLTNFYNKNIYKFSSSEDLKLIRKKILDNHIFNEYTLDSLRIENEKLENYRIKEILREFF